MSAVEEQLQSFVNQWQDGEANNKRAFLVFKEKLESQESVVFEFVPREGLTYSLRAKHVNQRNKPLFVMVDVIEGEPRWLSVCFYAEMVTDPEERGDFVPEGLLGEDALCFDVEEYSEKVCAYIEERIEEAYSRASV
ncbi:MAG: hypothetical protein V2I36_00780 [Desulfopila sp.]|jgi:hypothetical protein|nr:hypothetical protein [Desulfopila sp.]